MPSVVKIGYNRWVNLDNVTDIWIERQNPDEYVVCFRFNTAAQSVSGDIMKNGVVTPYKYGVVRSEPFKNREEAESWITSHVIAYVKG